MLVRKQLTLEQAVFKQRVQIEAGAAAVCCRRTQFPAGVDLRLRFASVVLDDADLAGPSILAGVPPSPTWMRRALPRTGPACHPRPKSSAPNPGCCPRAARTSPA